MALLFPTLQVKNTFLSLDDEDEDELDLGLARRQRSAPAGRVECAQEGSTPAVSSSRAAWALATEPDATNEQDMQVMPRVVTWEEIGMPVAPAHSYSGNGWTEELHLDTRLSDERPTASLSSFSNDACFVFLNYDPYDVRGTATTSPWECTVDPPGGEAPGEEDATREEGHDWVDVPTEWRSVVTIMARNLPNKYSQQMILDELNAAGFEGGYDFLYLPIDPETNANRGYAFINFINPSYAWLTRKMYEGKKMGKFNSEKVVSVVPAALQGFEANYAHYSAARVMRGPPQTRPLFLRECGKVKAERRRGGRRAQGSLIDVAVREKGEAGETKQISGAWGDTGAPWTAPEADSESSNFCQNCGGKVQPRFRFCQFCGGSLHQEVWGG